ncbi:phosphatase PAP2 family protein [Flavobacterium sp. NRK F7]|uniref:phosphatase PAP2 family protein n=1 Tax=Flavobacterium sp. NRK F7 TaxID=2954930 RepID=UPI00209016A9|nr:phosphatase PAP2 family protein [Flavobacterium sp. NRK F7]MCO6162945.1 phosphatase PAP2 family protein [Flavobacterium sp. NRK F7]
MRKFLLLLVFLCSQWGNTQVQSTFAESTGDALLYALPISTIATTIFIKDYKGLKQFSKGFLVNAVTTEALKLIIKKERPNHANFKSFPSGHTSITFQSAAFIQKRYGWEYGIPVYALAAFTGYSRIESKNHYFIDVLAGAAIGVSSSYLFTTKYERNLDVSLAIDSYGSSIIFVYQF